VVILLLFEAVKHLPMNRIVKRAVDNTI
jgi:hypothetical protein